MVTTDTAALRAAAQALTDAVEDDERRSGGLLSRTTLRRSAELRRCCLKRGLSRSPSAPRAASFGRSEMGRTTSSAAQRRRAREKTKRISVLVSESGVWRARGSLRATPS